MIVKGINRCGAPRGDGKPCLRRTAVGFRCVHHRDESDPFEGHRNQERHRTVGNRAWCDCGEWCYPRTESACACCREALSNENPCPTCGGTGIAPSGGEG